MKVFSLEKFVKSDTSVSDILASLRLGWPQDCQGKTVEEVNGLYLLHDNWMDEKENVPMPEYNPSHIFSVDAFARWAEVIGASELALAIKTSVKLKQYDGLSMSHCLLRGFKPIPQWMEKSIVSSRVYDFNTRDWADLYMSSQTTARMFDAEWFASIGIRR